MSHPWRSLVLLLLLLPACGDDDDDDDTPPADGPTSDAATDGASGQVISLIGADWQRPVDTEGYWCAVKTITEDLYIREFRPVAPEGTHHTALALTSGNPEGEFDCNAGTIGPQLLFGSGVGTAPFTLPDGVAFKLPAGQQIILNLHLYNATDYDLSGHSGIDVVLADPSEVQYEAETVYVINLDFEIPPGGTTAEARCTMSDDTTVFGVFPHMHRLGRHMQAFRVSGGSETLLHDRDYDFETQLNYLIEPAAQFQAGDVLKALCTWDNETADPVYFGDSSDEEMCVLGVYRYPARGSIGLCAN